MTSSADVATSYSTDDDVTSSSVHSSNAACTRLHIPSNAGLNILDINCNGWDVVQKEVEIEDFHPRYLECYRNLFIYVPQSHRRRVVCINSTTKKKISELTFGQEVRGMKVSGDHIIFILQNDVSIHHFSVYGLRPLHHLSDLKHLHPNKVAISNDVMACPGAGDGASLQLYSITTLRALTTIAAHQTPLSCVALNSDATMVATSSERGTLIRLFSVDTGVLIRELRRGLLRCAHIKSLVFSADSTLLVCSSSTQTIHIYKLDDHQIETSDPEQQGWFSYLSNSVLSTASLLTAGTTDPLFLERSFATIRSSPLDNKVHGFITGGRGPEEGLVVTVGEDVVRIFSVDPVNGGECQLKTEYFLQNDEETP